MSPFQSLGDRARWEVVYEVLKAASFGDIVTYEHLGEVLNLDPVADRHRIQMAVRRAGQQHEQHDKRALDSVTNVGYRIVEAGEHVRLARRHQSKASKALVRGHSKAVNVDLSRLDPEARHALEVVGRAFALQMDFNRRMDVRQKRLEAAIGDVTKGQERTAAEVADLQARLERLEQGA